jgi:hypothetical protein
MDAETALKRMRPRRSSAPSTAGHQSAAMMSTAGHPVSPRKKPCQQRKAPAARTKNFAKYFRAPPDSPAPKIPPALSHSSHPRQAALEILNADNSCSAWFRQFDPQAADTLHSLTFSIDMSGPDRVLRETVDDNGSWREHGTVRRKGSGKSRSARRCVSRGLAINEIVVRHCKAATDATVKHSAFPPAGTAQLAAISLMALWQKGR